MTRDEAIYLLKQIYTGNPNDKDALNMAIEALEVKHGEWIDYKGDNNEWLRDDGKTVFCQCSKCKELYVRNFMYKFNYCPNCGARMDERGEDE